jgi:hypothetical protein
MLPVIDICHSITGGGNWYTPGTSTGSGNFAAYTTYLEGLVAAGWEYCAQETGVLDTSSTGYSHWTDWVVHCGFLGCINYNGGGDAIWPYNFTNFNAVVLNSCEFYFTGNPSLVMPGNTTTMSDTTAIQQITLSASQLGIPNGICAGVWPDAPLLGTHNQPFANTINGVGMTYEGMIDWSYANGVPFCEFEIWVQPNNDYLLLNYYLECGFDQIITSLMEKYPPAGTENLVQTSITHRMPAISFNIFLESAGHYAFGGQLTDLITGAPLAGQSVVIQSSANDYTTWTNVVTVTTDSNGNWSTTPTTLSSGNYWYRAYYAGATVGGVTYLPTFFPYNIHGYEIQVP